MAHGLIFLHQRFMCPARESSDMFLVITVHVGCKTVHGREEHVNWVMSVCQKTETYLSQSALTSLPPPLQVTEDSSFSSRVFNPELEFSHGRDHHLLLGVSRGRAKGRRIFQDWMRVALWGLGLHRRSVMITGWSVHKYKTSLWVHCNKLLANRMTTLRLTWGNIEKQMS